MQADEITGIIERFLFKNDENGYAVCIVQAGKQTITAVGTLGTIQSGQQVTLQGTWTMHAKFGMQFTVTQCTSQLPTSTVGLKKYLGSGLIKGIGKTYAEKLVDYFGNDILTIIDTQPDRLQEVPGIGTMRAQKIAQAWQEQREVANIMLFLQSHGASPAFAAKIFKHYGNAAVAIIQENPYRLAEDVWGVGFKTADHIAQHLGFEKESIKRIKAGLVFSMSQIVNNGHLYSEIPDLKKKACEILEIDLEQHELSIKHALVELYDAGTIKLITHEQKHYIALAQHYFVEKGVASRIKSLIEYRSKHAFDIEKIYTHLRTKSGISLNEDQQRGIIACLQHKITVITGGPGTGKTTLIKSLLDILDTHKVSYKLAAPTGRAAKRIYEGTRRYAYTLHRLLEFDFTTMGFVHNESNALQLDFLIVDESSMIDIFLAHALLKAVPLPAHILFIGDIDQLPSVGAGNFLKNIISSALVPTIRLTHIFRQAQDSLIIVNAHRINNGQFPLSYLPDARKDFIYIKEDDPAQAITHIQHIYQHTLAAHGIQEENAVVLAPMNKGVVGTHMLNKQLQAFLNPQDVPHVALYATLYKVGDKVMQIKNNYDKNVFNGDIGRITAIDAENQQLHVSFYEQADLVYEYSELDELVLAYATTIHKSQGSEYDAAIIPLFTQHFTLLQRNLVYTALTRAKKLGIFIGQTKAIGMAIRNNKGLERKTFLTEFLTTDLTCR